ncbi:MAG: hypothetical protein PHE03_09255 [Bacteroidales bacterium]|nr:hypothetical protein [Bacteroidales bacterium]MDD3892473.1 hypothetical protein [Bacteroidales bacterium]
MKKTLTLIAVLCSFSLLGISQNTFNKGDKVLNAGIGLGNALYTGSGYTSKTPPLSLSFEVGVVDELFDEKSSLGIGGYIGYSGAKWEYSGWGWKYTNFIIGARGVGHYQLIDKFDTYTGLLLGYDIVNSKEIGAIPGMNGYSASGSSFIWAWFIGGRYYFSDSFGAMAELGYGISYLTLGISYKF